MGIVFGILVENNFELPESDERRKLKYRVVFQGNRTINQDWAQAVFTDGSSKPVAMEVGKIADWYACLPGHAQEQADAEKAYVQADMRVCETWVNLPNLDECPSAFPGWWKDATKRMP